jgi:lysophospholipase L1-like esterase
MSLKKTKNKSLFLLLLVIFYSNCSLVIKNNYSNYHSPNFICSEKPGWDRNPKGFQNYLLAWRTLKEKYNNSNKNTKTSKIVFVGNSLIQLFTDELLSKEFPGMDIQNRGIGGDTTYLLLERLEENVISLKPQIIVLEIGGNDLIQGKCISYIEDNFKKIVRLIQTQLPETRIILMSVPPTSVPDLNSIVPIYNTTLLNVANQSKNITYIEVWSEMRDKNSPSIKKELTRERDKIHFNELGYSTWGKLIRPYLK